jgi:von Willebrand factor type A domain.
LTIMLAIAIVAMYTFGSIGTVFAGGTSTTQNASITTSKTASWADGATNKDASIANVNLTLDCQNAVQVTTSSTRIVLVLDRSGSMGDKTNGVSKLDRLKSTLTTADTGFIDKVLGIPNADVQIAVVSYSSDETAGYDKYGVLHAGCSQVTTNSGFSSSAADLKAAVNGIDAWGGTNTQAGIRQAESLLSTVIADNEYIILLSDGEPTFSYKATAAVPADTGLNFNSTEWRYRITEFSNDIVGTGDSYIFNPYSLINYSYVAETYGSDTTLSAESSYYLAINTEK